MTVKELRDKLNDLIDAGHADTNVIARCEFTITKGNGYYNDFPFCNFDDVYYQSGDIELAFSDGSSSDDIRVATTLDGDWVVDDH